MVIKMADRNRYRRNRQESKDVQQTERQANFLTFQILMVLLLLAAVWAAKSLHLKAFEDIRRLSALLEGDTKSVSAVIGSEELTGFLQENLPVYWRDLLNRFGLLSEEAVEDGMGGVYPGTLNAGAERPRNVTFSPVLLTAQPRVPVSGRVSSGFGWRDNPLAPGRYDFHTGLDIAAAEGTVILAALPGVVSDTGYSDSYGNYLHIAHAGGLETHYAHCAELIAKTGEVIRQGERIALVGSTGNVTGPHLHFEIRQQGLCCDPLPQLGYAG
ncbi:MAG: M23 family metallopeptidase [Provencibacterium sp.]|jgi:murein DD-endopeptidase MepM/ murein hydrolase activator NlpD|nr:M23 family metallopeptidase [Provencibacterium sp.]